MIRTLAILLATTAATGAVAAAEQPSSSALQPAGDAAALFGARESVGDISLSPDGSSVAFLVPSNSGRGNSLYTVQTGSEAPPKRVLTASGDPEELSYCRWVSNDRLVCNIRVLRQDSNALVPVSLTRMIAVDSAGGNVKVISRRDSPDAVYRVYFGGEVIDWLPGEDGAVLMGRTYVPEDRENSNYSSSLNGYGVDRIDTRTLAFKRIETPRKDAFEYITDGQGHVRLMAVNPTGNTGYAGKTIRYFYRPDASGKWDVLTDYEVGTRTGFEPVAVDPKLNVAYGFQRKDGKLGLYTMSLDGARNERLVFEHPEVDVDGLIRLGRSQRVVGASYATEKRQVAFFDPELKALAASLSKALPANPLIDFAGASADESKLLIRAASDVDPGRYYLLDRTTKKLGPLMAARPQLEGVTLATVKAVTYKAADGTAIPAYLTLPPGSTGKNIPAIVMPHGGPAARDEWGFDWLAQFYANRGYAVLQPNFRGSAGYGDAWFQKNGFQSWRTAIGDVTDGGRWLVSQGIADPGKLAIVGWSYGGYAALQSAVIAPDLFKAVVAVAPVTDLSALKTDQMNYFNGSNAKDTIGSGPHVIEGSPAQNAGAIKAPVMMFHGTLDQNVLIRQSRIMDDKLAGAGKRHQLVVYPNLDHQLDDSVARADMLRKSDQFLRSAMGM